MSDSLRAELIILLWLLLIKNNRSAVAGVQWVIIRASVAHWANLTSRGEYSDRAS